MTRLEAFQDSIEHWERLTKCTTKKQIEKEGIRTKECALCYKYFDRYAEDYKCTGCPIKVKTGESLCYDSPWEEANRIQNYSSLNLKDWQKASGEMLQFLIDLKKKYTKEK